LNMVVGYDVPSFISESRFHGDNGAVYDQVRLADHVLKPHSGPAGVGEPEESPLSPCQFEKRRLQLVLLGVGGRAERGK
jgi:hypothetical protein